MLFAIFTSLWTERLWFQSIDYSTVFTTSLVTRLGMFAVFGLLMAVAVLANVWIAYRVRPRYRAMSSEQQTLDRYREVVDPHRKLVALLVALGIGLIAGWSAASRWTMYLQWRNAEVFGTQDPQFGLDPSFYIFGYPWYRFLIGFGFAIVILGLIVGLITHYLYGGIRLQTQGQRASAASQAHISVLLGLFVLLKAVAYWFDRYGLALGTHQVSQQSFTGITYTDAHAVLPAKTILTFIAVICAVLFFANVVRRTWLLPGIGVGLLLLSAVLLGWAWPAVVQQFQVLPNEPDRERPYIQRNIDATRYAYGIEDTKVIPYEAETEATEEQQNEAETAQPNVRLIDPAVVGKTFDQLQQVRGYYTFADPLDIDRYEINGETRDTVVALREMSLDGVGQEQRNWANDHTVFTHGFGFVAAYGDQRTSEGAPEWAERDVPPTGELGDYEPRVYYGEESPTYSIVGQPKGEDSWELDRPGTTGEATYTYKGDSGVPIGSFFNRVLYAMKFQEATILLTDRVNSESKVLYDRSPRDRVQKAAPWLRVDSNPYPAVVDGRIKWILDGYTHSDSYPLSQRLDWNDATSDSLTARPAIAGQPSSDVNYIRNSVKATVDAYDGSVELYAWDESDPILRTWRNAFPGTVKPKKALTDQAELLEHLRYPEDIMKVQRDILAQYHVTDAPTFYEGSERWKIPEDPTRGEAVKQPPYYLSVRMPGQDGPVFSQTGTYIYHNRQNLAAFFAVNSDARSDDFGTIRVLQLADKTQIDGPNQIANKLKGDNEVSGQLLPLQRQGNEVIHGNLLTLPIGGSLLYVQPVYVEAGSGTAYPLMRLVLASSGGRIGVGVTLDDALAEVYGDGDDSGDEQGDEQGGEQGDGGDEPPPDGSGQPEPPESVQAEIDKANEAFARADQELKEGNLDAYARWIERAKAAVQRAGDAQAQANQDAQQSGNGDAQGGQADEEGSGN